ncbi:hypothetical protein N2152v2_007919 [Parachlorella kessleri]
MHGALSGDGVSQLRRYRRRHHWFAAPFPLAGVTPAPAAASATAAAGVIEAAPGQGAPAQRGGVAQEQQEELALHAGARDIYGMPRSDWLRLQTPARYLGNEFGAVHKPWGSASIRFALTYPEIYEVGASNLGHIILYSLLNQQEGLLCDRAYFPGDDMKALLGKYGKKLFGVESRRTLDEFDVLGFSLSYELGGTNILEMLQLSGIPVSWEERKEAPGRPWDPEGGSPPLVFAGGPTATSNPEPFADFFDFVVFGDGEEVLAEIGHCLKQCRAEGLDREAVLFRLATSVEGVYVPQFYEAPRGFGGAVFPVKEGVPAKIKRRVCAPDPFQQIGLVPFVTTVHDRLTVEIRRGCTRGCRFCQPGMLTRPARDVEPSRVVDAVEHGMRLTGYNEFSLLSLSCSDYLSLPSVGLQIKNRLRDENVSLSLPSQRVDRQAVFDDNVANIIANAGKRSGLTFAPEAGTQRLRDIINKGLTNEELLRGVKTAWDRGWKQVKLYFMIGLPGETDADVLGIAETVEWLQQECRQGRWHLAVNVTISNFTPKPHTPFQWHSVSTAEFERKQALLREAFSRLHQVKVNYSSIGLSAMEDFIGRGDRRIAKVIRRAWELGALNDGWWQSPEACFARWEQAIEESGLGWKYRQVNVGEWDVMEHLGDERYRGQGKGGRGRMDRGALADSRLDSPLPWDHVETGIAKWWLKTDLQRALEAATVPDCSHSGLCSECGVCGEEEEGGLGHNVVHEPPPIPEFEGHYRPNATKAQRLRFRFSKTGDAVFVGHLDMMKAFDRACRRAALPITADESPFVVKQRIYSIMTLGLGATSSCEVLEIFLTKKLAPHEVLQDLQASAQLPPGLRLLSVEDIPVYKIDGSNMEKMSQLLDSVEFYVALDQAEGGLSDQEAQALVHAALQQPHFYVDRSNKKMKGRRRAKQADLRPALLELEACQRPQATLLAQAMPEAVQPGVAVVRFRTSCDTGNPVWTPAHMLSLLRSVCTPAASPAGPVAADPAANKDGVGDSSDSDGSHSGGHRLNITHVHRSDISLRQPSVPAPDLTRLRSLCRMEGHLAAQRQYRGTGPWSGGLENRIDVD